MEMIENNFLVTEVPEFKALLHRARLRPNALQDAAGALDKSIRAQLRLKRSKETSLMKSDFSFRTPPVLPFWDGAWKEDKHMELSCLYHANKKYAGINEIAGMFARHFNSRQILPALACISWPGGRDLVFSYHPKFSKESIACSATLRSREPHTQVEPMRRVAQAWKLEELLLDATGKFRIKVDKKGIAVGNLMLSIGFHAMPGLPPDVSPCSFTMSGFRDMETALPYATNAMAALHDLYGPPANACFRVYGQQTPKPREPGIQDVLEYCRQSGKKWNMMFFSEYRRTFDPYAVPEDRSFERMYPVVRCIRERPLSSGWGKYAFLDLQVTVHHTAEGSSLLLHSQESYEFIEEIVKLAGIDAPLQREEDEYE